MDNLIEVEIENRSYIELLNLNKYDHKTLNLTTLVDNQTSVIIKIFLNKAEKRVLLKEFYIRNLKRKVSGLPRFEVKSSYNGKFLSLDLMVDGRKTDHSEINLRPYLRNKFLPLFIILSLLAVILLFTGGKWLFSEFLFNDAAAPTSINKEEDTKPKTAYEKPAKEVKTTLYTSYFLPNNTSIGKNTAQKLKYLAKKLKSTPNTLVEISGYCAMTGTKEGRERLSKERAYNVLNYLKKEGWIPETEPVVKWYGGTRPVTLNKKEIYKNRRVEIKIEIQ